MFYGDDGGQGAIYGLSCQLIGHLVSVDVHVSRAPNKGDLDIFGEGSEKVSDVRNEDLARLGSTGVMHTADNSLIVYKDK